MDLTEARSVLLLAVGITLLMLMIYSKVSSAHTGSITVQTLASLMRTLGHLLRELEWEVILTTDIRLVTHQAHHRPIQHTHQNHHHKAPMMTYSPRHPVNLQLIMTYTPDMPKEPVAHMGPVVATDPVEHTAQAALTVQVAHTAEARLIITQMGLHQLIHNHPLQRHHRLVIPILRLQHRHQLTQSNCHPQDTPLRKWPMLLENLRTF